MRIVFVGPPGSGKSTLAAAVFSALKQAGRSAELCQEWIRQDIMKCGPMTSIWEQYRTREYQKEIEDAVPDTVKYVICDSGTLSPFFFANLYADPSDLRQRLVLQDMYRHFIDDLYLNRYDMIFYIPATVAHNLDDGTRYQTDEEMATLSAMMNVTFTKVHKHPSIHVINAGVSDRVEEVLWKLLAAGEAERAPEARCKDVIDIINFLKTTSQAC